jgi:HTH-type transcriptional repressor of NAD biosynthesis genes
VVLVYESREVTRVPLDVRASWVRTLYPSALVIEGAEAPSATGREPSVMRLQEEYIATMVPGPISHFFSSEWYGGHVSAFLGAQDVRVDEDRVAIPVSGTQIRNDPSAYGAWLDPMVLRDLLHWDAPNT